MRSESWRLKALCRGLPAEIFFPEERGLVDPYDEARAICANCSVKEPCLALTEHFAASGDRNGMFGGMSPAERKTFRKHQRRSITLRKTC